MNPQNLVPFFSEPSPHQKKTEKQLMCHFVALLGENYSLNSWDMMRSELLKDGGMGVGGEWERGGQ